MSGINTLLNGIRAALNKVSGKADTALEKADTALEKAVDYEVRRLLWSKMFEESVQTLILEALPYTVAVGDDVILVRGGVEERKTVTMYANGDYSFPGIYTGDTPMPLYFISQGDVCGIFGYIELAEGVNALYLVEKISQSATAAIADNAQAAVTAQEAAQGAAQGAASVDGKVLYAKNITKKDVTIYNGKTVTDALVLEGVKIQEGKEAHFGCLIGQPLYGTRNYYTTSAVYIELGDTGRYQGFYHLTGYKYTISPGTMLSLSYDPMDDTGHGKWWATYGMQVLTTEQEEET